MNNVSDVLGLNINAEIDRYTSRAYKLWDQLLILCDADECSGSPVTTTGSATAVTLDIIERVFQSLPPLFDIEVVKESIKDNMTPTTSVLLQVSVGNKNKRRFLTTIMHCVKAIIHLKLRIHCAFILDL